jgi:hypothetical protein
VKSATLPVIQQVSPAQLYTVGNNPLGLARKSAADNLSVADVEQRLLPLMKRMEVGRIVDRANTSG